MSHEKEPARLSFDFSSSFVSFEETVDDSNHRITRSSQDSLAEATLENNAPGERERLPFNKYYDYKLKFLLVGDSDVGKQEILNGLNEGQDDEGSSASPFEVPFCGSPGVGYKSTLILLDGKRILLQLWDTSGQGRFSTIIRSYSRGAQGILLVYDITNKWSFSGLDRWLHEVEEVSPLCNYNIRESFAELSRIVLKRHGMESLWKHSTVLSLQELCCRAIVARTTVYGIDQLPLPSSLKSCLKSYSSMTSSTHKPSKMYHQKEKDKDTLKRKAKALFSCDTRGRSKSSSKSIGHKSQPQILPQQAQPHHQRRSCTIS